MTTFFIIAALIGYFCGSVPFGLLLTRAAGLGDVRAIGSGNIGTTNVLRTGHKGLAAATLLLDAGKGAVAVLICNRWGVEYAAVAGACAVLGHSFPVWLKFRGGKGVATSLGVLLALAWPVGLAACAIWLAVAFAWRYSSLAALSAIASGPVLALVFARAHERIVIAVAALALAALVFARHRENIRRLRRGEESKIGARSTGTPPSSM